MSVLLSSVEYNCNPMQGTWRSTKPHVDVQEHRVPPVRAVLIQTHRLKAFLVTSSAKLAAHAAVCGTVSAGSSRTW